ncbi:hypothetical protein GCM10017673_13760 [Streptosporangium violaceochromogenes]|nr:hypothetical protein GCM10017673_13760 [Streptosporangium violaceochromogenes]
MIGQPRTPGRHRAGRPYSLVHRRVWDGPARAEAEYLERSYPGWVVLYGVGTRRFCAMAAWPAPEPVMVEAATAEDLAERMGEAETTLLLRATTPTAPGDPDVSGRPRRPGSRRRAVRAAGSLPYPPEGNTA